MYGGEEHTVFWRRNLRVRNGLKDLGYGSAIRGPPSCIMQPAATFAMCVCVCVCVYIYIYIYTHTHTHTHIYIYIYIQGVPGGMCQTSGGCSLC